MGAKWMIIPAFALLLSGCAGMQKPKIFTVDKDTFFVEAEDFGLTDARVMDLEGASGGKTVVFEDASSKAEATIPLSKGNYEITVYGMGPSYEEDAFFLTVDENAEQRMWMETPGDIMPTMEYYSYTQQADSPCHILLTYIEPNVELDRVKFVRIQ